MNKIRKKGQEEIIGFVVIIVIVAVVFLVVLGLYLRQKAPATQKESIDVEQFLDSAMKYTSECTTSSERHFSLSELIRECYSHSICLSGEDSCSILNRTLQEIIEINWQIGSDRPFKGYKFNSTYSYGSNVENILVMSEGSCTGEKIGAEYLTPSPPGGIINTLEICS